VHGRVHILVTGTGTSALRWPSYARAILRCWQAISTGSGAGTPPPVHTATALTRRQSTWCSGVQLTTRPEETSGWEDYSTRIHDASGSSWSGLGRWPPPPTGNEREHTYLVSVGVFDGSRSVSRCRMCWSLWPTSCELSIFCSSLQPLHIKYWPTDQSNKQLVNQSIDLTLLLGHWLVRLVSVWETIRKRFPEEVHFWITDKMQTHLPYVIAQQLFSSHQYDDSRRVRGTG